MLLPLLPACIIAFACGSCRTGERDGIPPLIRPNFWNYYRRGLALAMHKRWSEAAGCFSTAIGESGDAVETDDVDRWRAKTYGLHFLDNYFPHRELGICCYFMKDYERAETELETSLSQTPSARASHYINQVRKAQLAAQELRHSPEIIAFAVQEPSRKRVLTNRPVIPVRARVSSPYRIEKVAVNGRRALVETAVATFALNERLELDPGTNELAIAARDLAGNANTWSGSVHLDLEAPSITMGLDRDNPDKILVVVQDNQGLQSLTVQDQSVAVAPEATRVEHRLRAGDATHIEVLCSDLAGNVAHAREPTGLIQGAWLVPNGLREYRIASASETLRPRFYAQAPPDSPPESEPAADSMPPIVRFIQSDAKTARAPEEATQPMGEQLPTLHIKMDRRNLGRAVTNQRYARLVIRMNDGGSGLSHLVFTNPEGGQETRHALKKGAQSWTQNRTLDLDLGDNAFTIATYDVRGNARTVKLTVRRIEDVRLGKKYRMSVAIAEPTCDPELTRHLNAQVLEDFVLKSLLLEPRRLNVVERDTKTLECLLMERLIDESGQAGNNPVNIRDRSIRLAEWWIKVTATPWAGDSNWQLALKAIDSDQTVTLFVDVHLESFSWEDLQGGIQDLAGKIRREIPSLTGEVLTYTEDRVTILLPQNHNLKENMWFLFQDPETPDCPAPTPFEVQVAGRNRPVWVQGKVSTVGPGHCTLDIHPDDSKSPIRKGTLAVAR